jgi:pimeloyl-ACP methyl ester carboxylesterase
MNEKTANSLIPQTFIQNIGDAELTSLRYDGEGPPLIFLHATGFMPWLWHPVARELAGDYRIFAPYFCAHRNADPENGGVNWRTLAEDLALFCERLHLEKPFLVGHSMGATVAVIANALYGIPAAGMVLIEPIFIPQELYRAPSAWSNIRSPPRRSSGRTSGGTGMRPWLISTPARCSKVGMRRCWNSTSATGCPEKRGDSG